MNAAPGLFTTWRRIGVVLSVVAVAAFVVGGAVALVVPRPTPAASPVGSAPSGRPSAGSGPASDPPAPSSGPRTPSPIAQSAYYLSPTGDDANPGTIAAPWRTLARADASLRPGDVLSVGGGTYVGQALEWHASGTPAKPITIRAVAGEHAVFDGTGTAGPFLLFGGSVANVVLADLTIRGYHPTDTGIVVLVGRASGIVLDGLTMTENTGPTQNEHLIYIADPAVRDVTIRNSRLEGIGGGAIHMFHAPSGQHVLIENNVISDCHWGVIVTSAAGDVRIAHNTFLGNDIAVELGDAHDVQIVDNVSVARSAAGGLGFGLWVDDPAAVPGLVEDHNLWYRGGRDAIRTNAGTYDLLAWRAATGQSAHSLDADPRLDATGQPAADSPVRGAASDGGSLGAG